MYNFAQTFYIHSDSVKGADYVTLPRIDILPTTYPRPSTRASAGLPDPGVTLSICEVNEQGIPDPDLELRGARITMTREGMRSARIANWVPFYFEVPAIVKTNKTYALLIHCEGDSDFRFGTHRRTLTTSERRQGLPNPGFYADGELFQLADGTPKKIVGQDLNMRLFVAKHTRTSATINVVNDATEFLTVNAHSTEFFFGDEIVYDANTSIRSLSNGTIRFGIFSTAVAGNGTSFTSDFAPGSVIIMTNAANTEDFATNTDIDVAFATVVSVIDDENLTIANEPTFSANQGFYFVTPTARVYTDTPSSNQLVLYSSSAANSSFRFQPGSYLRGIDSHAEAVVSSVDDFEVSRITPEINAFIPSGTRLTFDITIANTSYGFDNARSVTTSYDANTDITTYRAAIASRSNEVANSTVRASLFQNVEGADPQFKYKSAAAFIRIETDNEYSSPVLIEENVDFFIYTNDITADVDIVDEVRGVSPDSARYISKTVTLAQGLDAEDLRVYLTAYRPPGSDIKVYAKLHNSYDPDLFEDKVWSELEVKRVASDTAISPPGADGGVEQGYVEFEYGLPTRPSGQDLHVFVGFAGIGQNAETITITNYSSAADLQPGDVVTITNPDNRNRPMISSVVSRTISGTDATITLDAPVTDSILVGGGMIVEKVGEYLDETAFTNTKNKNVVRYYKDGTKYDNFKSYAIKIVLTSIDPSLAPRVSDYRALAMSA